MIEHAMIPEERIELLRKNEKWKEQLKKFCDVEVRLNEFLDFEGDDPLILLRIKEVFKAFGRGFDFEDALDLLDEEYFLETIEVKEYAGKSRDRQITLKGRVIGKEGKIKKIIEKFCNVKIAIYGKTVSIVGKWKNVQLAKEAIEMLLKGKMHSTVYKFLERRRVG